MSTVTTNTSLVKPDVTEPAAISVINSNMDLIDLFDHSINSKGLPVKRLFSGVAGSRGAAGTAGTVYFATDTGVFSLDTGAAWVDGITLTSTGNLSGKTYSATLTGATSAARLVGGTASGAPSAGTFLVGDLVVDDVGRTWVCTVAGTPGTWVGNFYGAGLTGAVSAARFVGGTATIAPTTGTFAAGDFVVAQNGTAWACSVAGSPGTWVQVGATTTVLHSVAVNDTVYALRNFL